MIKRPYLSGGNDEFSINSAKDEKTIKCSTIAPQRD